MRNNETHHTRTKRQKSSLPLFLPHTYMPDGQSSVIIFLDSGEIPQELCRVAGSAGREGEMARVGGVGVGGGDRGRVERN